MPSIDERSRHDLFEAVQDKLGPRHADTLMSLLPPVGWADLDTQIALVRADVGALEARMDHRFEQVDQRFDGFEQRLRGALHKSQADHLRVMIFAFVGSLVTMTSVCLSAVALVT